MDPGWIGTTHDGTEAAYLLAATPDTRAASRMPLVAQALGLDPRPGVMTLAPAGAAYVTLDQELRVTLIVPGVESWVRPVTEEWAGFARRRGPVVLTVGFLPFDVDADPLLYADRVSQTSAFALGVIPVHDPDHDRGHGIDHGRDR